MSNKVLIGVILGLTICGAGQAAAPKAPPTGLPPGVFPGAHDYKLAPAGTYALDSQHVGVIARVSHLGYSYSIFRFGDVTGQLGWNPASPAKSTLKVTIKTASIETNVKGFAEELAGDKYLNAATYPEATFVSTAFRKTDAAHGKVDGKLTLMGKTRPVTFDVTLVGAGKGFMGSPRIGAHAETWIKGTDFGLSPMIGGPLQLVIDTEFSKEK